MPGKKKLKILSASLNPGTDAPVTQQEQTLYDQKCALIAARYVYYQSKKHTFEQALELLSAEFFITERQVTNIILGQTDIINNIKEEKRAPSWFKKRWQFLVW